MATPTFTLTADQQSACTDFLSRLVATPSLSGQEAAVARQVADEMRNCGFPGVRCDRIGNIVGRYGRPGGPVLLLNAHMDTVDVADPDAWRHDPFGAEIQDGQLFGRGSADMKGALAAMVHGIGLLCRQGIDLPGEVIVAAVVQEEPTEGMAMRVLVQEEGIRPDWVILGEPTNLQLARGQRGRMELHVTVFGRSAHASSPEAGENALANAARLIFGLELQNASLMSDPVLGKATLAVTGIDTLTASRNAIPDRCDLIIDRRLTLGETPARALAEIEAVMQRERVRGKVETGAYRSLSYTGYECTGPEVYPAWLLPADHPLLQQSQAVIERSLGRRPTVGIWAFSTDGVYTMGEAGIPTLGFGPGDARLAHTSDESIPLGDVHLAAAAYAALAVDLLGYLARRYPL
ncbi:MAG: YgeY family selenium metabolism-linked hydrolase [Caldilineales bacterium]|nr:YgeY family selenium metabolism-linked hydrolase [Caldilineales bacterium]MCW5857304.1 YgeY family selenium metabolism-linked hydrolase [Caldilineales bacterium]